MTSPSRLRTGAAIEVSRQVQSARASAQAAEFVRDAGAMNRIGAAFGNEVGPSYVAAVARHPDVVIIVSGHNDSRWSAAATSNAAGRVIDGLRNSLPDVVIVLVAPIWQDGSPPLYSSKPSPA